MRCPHCIGENTQVKDSRPTEDNTAIRRRRVCPNCDARFTTFERVQLRELQVLKRSGRQVPFDREKLAKSVHIALRKRPVDVESVDVMLSDIVRRLESRGDAEIPSATIGAYVMAGLKTLDPVGYIRFASVYRDFREVADFQEVLGEISAAVDEDVVEASDLLRGEETAPQAQDRTASQSNVTSLPIARVVKT